MTSTIINIREGINVLRQFLIPRAFTPKLIEFTNKEGIFSVIGEMGRFTREDFYEALSKRLKYKTEDRARKRMVNVLLDFLAECSQVFHRFSHGTPEIYIYNKNAKLPAPLPSTEIENLEKIFRDQYLFFDRCIYYAGDFLRGGNYLHSFSEGMESIWDRFLGSYEFSIARDILLRAMAINKKPGCKIMDLCYGTGQGLKTIIEYFQDAYITAIDFTDTMRPFVQARIGSNSAKVQWMDATKWSGFGETLPFEDITFDRIFFSCGDPYIPQHLREVVYKEIFRILKPGGILGVVAWGYPDRGKRRIQNGWVRRSIYIHDFAESVCEGWHGFSDIDSRIKMARDIGFVENSLFNNFYMLDSAVWMFKRP